MKSWVEQWLGRKDSRAAVLLALFDPVSRGISSSIQTYLQETAKKGRMEFVALSPETPDAP